MGLNIKKLREKQKEIKKKSGDDDLFLYASKLTEDHPVRILPTLPNMGGDYFLESQGWWVAGKYYPHDIGNDPIGEEIDKAKEEEDESIIALLNRKKNNMPVIKHETRYSLGVLELKPEYNDDEELVSCKVEGMRVLVAKPTLIREINKIVTSRQYQNKSEWGILDRKIGTNITLAKEGKGTDTTYSAMGWRDSMEMDEKYYKDKELPDLLAMHKKSVKSDAYLVSVIRNYLYGEDVLEEEDSPKKKKKKKTKKSLVQAVQDDFDDLD